MTQALAALDKDEVEKQSRVVALDYFRATSQDDTDNRLSIDGYGKGQGGVLITAAEIQNSRFMADWLGESNLYEQTYVARLGTVIALRYHEFRVVGAGAYGIVVVASRLNTRCALKFTRVYVAGTTNVKTHAEEEVAINLTISGSRRVGLQVPYFPRVTDWTRGQMDIASALQMLGDPKNCAELKGVLMTPGIALFLVQQMDAYDLSLDDWMKAVRTSAGTDPDALRVAGNMLLAFIVVLLVQLHAFRTIFPGFMHADIRAPNVLLLRVDIVHAKASIIETSFGGGRRVVVLPADTGGYAASMSDLGLASMREPAYGPQGRKNYDLYFIGSLLQRSWVYEDPAVKEFADLLVARGNDAGTPEEVEQIFAAMTTAKFSPKFQRFIV
jgi:hypothetical protein